MYYVMSVPEIFVLLFILGLWMVSIFFCYKRYEKINTIERADMPNFNAKNPNQSLDTQSCHSLSKSKNNSLNNVNSNVNCTGSINNIACNQLYLNKNNHSFNEFNSCFGTNNSIVCNNILYEKLNAGSVGQSNFYIIDESKITNNKMSRVEVTYQKYHRYKKNVYSNQFPSYTPQYVQHKPNIGLYQFKAIMGQSLSKKNINLESLNCSKNDISNFLQKSNSEPALQELFTDVKKQKIDFDKGMIKSNSIEHANDLDYNENQKLSNKRASLNYNNKSFNDNNLLDPHLIPKVIQKSLIDLHKRSVWNLARKPQQNKSKSNSKNALNFLNLKGTKSKESNNCSKSNSQNNFTTFVTQIKNGTEIKMKVNDNFV